MININGVVCTPHEAALITAKDLAKRKRDKEEMAIAYTKANKAKTRAFKSRKGWR